MSTLTLLHAQMEAWIERQARDGFRSKEAERAADRLRATLAECAAADPIPAELMARLRDDSVAFEQAVQGRAVFDGTLRTLIACYRTDPISTYHDCRFKTRENYDSLLRRIEREQGDTRIADIRSRDLKEWHRAWEGSDAPGSPTLPRKRTAMAHSLVGMLRTLVGYGFTGLEDAECERMSAILHKMRFPMSKPRTEIITAEQAIAVRRKAHEMGRPSIALAQAFQFDGTLRQKDVIGEYVPVSEPGSSDLISTRNRAEVPMKWLRGIRWEEIDASLVLRHVTSKIQKPIEIDLTCAPMVLDEIALLKDRPTHGPIIISEVTGLPWTNYEFRRWWRKIARACGIPDQVRNMDSRAGAISEAITAGAKIEHVRHAATHADIHMTARYDRNAADITRGVMLKRVEHRKATGE